MTCKIGSFADAAPLREAQHAAQFVSPEAAHAGRNVFPVSPCRRKSSASTRHAYVNHLQIGRSTSLQGTCTRLSAKRSRSLCVTAPLAAAALSHFASSSAIRDSHGFRGQGGLGHRVLCDGGG